MGVVDCLVEVGEGRSVVVVDVVVSEHAGVGFGVKSTERSG